MKKFARAMAILALIFALLGFMLILVGGFGGGIAMLKTLAREGELSFGPEEFGFDRVVSLEEQTMFNEKFQIFRGSGEFDTRGEEIAHLVIDMSGVEVTVRQGKEEFWQVSVEGAGKFQVYVSGNTLYVVGSRSGLAVEAGDVVIRMPEGATLETASLSLGAGEMEVSGLSAEKVDLSVGAGAIRLDETTIGDVTMDVGMGSLHVEGNIAGDVDASVAMGELTLEVRGSREQEHNYELSCAAGEIKVGSAEYAGLGTSRRIDNQGDTTYKLECAMGSLKVRFTEG